MGGADKALKPLAGRPLLAHVIDRLSPQVEILAINANGDPARFARFGLDVVPDTLPGGPGPLAGVLAGMEWASRQGFSHIVTAATDTPFLPPDLVAGLSAMAGLTGREIAIARSMGRDHPVFGYWPVALTDDLAEYLTRGESFKMRAYVFDRHLAAYAEFPALDGCDPFFNINTPDDLKTAEDILRSRTP
jgi:molybdopterin-guanine dinucleotide biosynthesis protein A